MGCGKHCAGHLWLDKQYWPGKIFQPDEPILEHGKSGNSRLFTHLRASQLDCSALSVADALARQLKTEKILLINAGLDAAYIGSGFLLRHLSSKSETRSDLLKGYGNSLILQGAFLMVFDLTFWQVLGHHRPESLTGFGLSASPQMTGLYASFRF